MEPLLCLAAWSRTRRWTPLPPSIPGSWLATLCNVEGSYIRCKHILKLILLFLPNDERTIQSFTQHQYQSPHYFLPFLSLQENIWRAKAHNLCLSEPVPISARCCEVLFREKSEYYSRENINSDPSCELSCHIGHIWGKCIFESLVNFMRNLCFRSISNPENNRQTAVRLTEKFLGFSVITSRTKFGLDLNVRKQRDQKIFSSASLHCLFGLCFTRKMNLKRVLCWYKYIGYSAPKSRSKYETFLWRWE